jgi:iron complex transport system substrate-binding protein
VTISHSRGTTTVPSRPRRIVTLTDRDTDTVLALGARPVGIRTIFGFRSGAGPWASARLGDAKPRVWTARELDYEGIAALRPDLIVNANSDGDAKAHRLLQRIAPTVALPRGEVPFGASTSSTTLLVAKALGEEQAGRTLLEGFDAFLARQAQRHPEFARFSATYLDVYDGGILAYSDRHVVNRALGALGFRGTAKAKAIPARRVSEEVSSERVGEYAADVMVVYPYGRTLDQLERQVPTLRSLEAARRDRVVLLDDLAFSASSVLSLRYGLERLVPRLAASVAEDR